MIVDDEIWLPIEGYEGFYEISNLGGVRSLDRVIAQRISRESDTTYTRNMKGIILSQNLSGAGYYFVNLIKPGIKKKPCEIHRMVASAFIDKHYSHEKLEVCHNDGNKLNNYYRNLRWDTRSNNHKDKTLHGTNLIGELNPMATFKPEEVILIRHSTLTYEVLAQIYNTSISQISRIKNYKIWKHIS